MQISKHTKVIGVFTVFSLLFFIGVFLGFYYDQTSFLSIWRPWTSVIEESYTINAVLSDQADYAVPFLDDFFNDYTLWNKDVSFGVPYALMLFNGLLFPLHFLFLIFDNQLAITLTYIIRTTFAGYFMYLFLRDIKIKTPAAIVSSIFYMFSGQALITIGVTVGYIVPFIPLLFLAINKLFDKEFKPKLLLLTISTIFIISSGFPSVIFYTLLFSGFYFLHLLYLNKQQGSRSKLISYIVGSIFAFLILAIILIPTYEYFQNIDLSYREADYSMRKFPWRNILNFFNPYYFGSTLYGTWWGGGNESEFALYSGVLPSLLFLPGIYLILKNRIKRLYYFFVASVLIIIILFNFFNILETIKHLPVFNFNPSTRLNVILPFFMLTVAAYGLDQLFQIKHWLKEKIIIALIAIPLLVHIFLGFYLPIFFTPDNTIIVNLYGVKERFLQYDTYLIPPILISIFIFGFTSFYIFKNAKRNQRNKTIFSGLVIAFILIGGLIFFNRNSIVSYEHHLGRITYFIHFLITLGIAGISLFLILNKKIQKYFAITILCALSFLDVYLYTGLFNPPTRKETFYPDTSATQFLKNNLEENERILTIDRALLPNMNVPYDIASVQGHHITDANYKNFMREIDDRYLLGHGTSDFLEESSDFNSPVIDLFNTKYLLSLPGFDPELEAVVYQSNFNDSINLTKNPVEQTFKLNTNQEFNIVGINIANYELNSPTTIVIEITDQSGKSIFLEQREIGMDEIEKVIWLYPEIENEATLKKEEEYVLRISLTRDLEENENLNLHCCHKVDCLRIGELKDNKICKDISFKILQRTGLQDKWKKIFSQDIDIYENMSPSRVGVSQIAKIEFLENDDQYFVDIENNDIINTAYLRNSEKENFEITTFNIDESDKIDIIDYKDDYVTIQSSTKDEAFIKIPDSYYPGWKAYIDGEETEIYRTDLIFRGIRIPAGEHTVIMKYRPDSFKIGLAISSLSFVVFVGYNIVFLKNLKFKNKIKWVKK